MGCEKEFANRYTEDDKDFMQVKNMGIGRPPIIFPWLAKDRGGGGGGHRGRFGGDRQRDNRGYNRERDNRGYHRNRDDRGYNRDDRGFNRDERRHHRDRSHDRDHHRDRSSSSNNRERKWCWLGLTRIKLIFVEDCTAHLLLDQVFNLLDL